MRDKIISEALSWLGTPYHPHGTIKGAGVDCGMLPLIVYQSCGLIPSDFSVGHYSPDFYQHKSEEIYLRYADTFGERIPIDTVQPGDFALWKFGRVYSHGGIFITPSTVIHATLRDSKVVLSDITTDHDLYHRSVIFFKPKEL